MGANKPLVLRRNANGVRVEHGVLPQIHVFPAGFLQREIQTGLVEVTVRLNTEDGPHEYRVTGYEQLTTGQETGDRYNWTGLVGELLTGNSEE